MIESEQQQEISPEFGRIPAYQSPLMALGSSIITLTNPEDEISKLELTFRNVSPDKKGNLVPLGPPLLNEDGVSRMVGLTQSFVNKVLVLGDTPEKEKMEILLSQAETVITELMLNWKRYGINPVTRYSTRKTIITEIMNMCIITVNRSTKEGDRRFWKGSTMEYTTRIDQGQPKRSIWSKLSPFGGK